MFFLNLNHLHSLQDLVEQYAISSIPHFKFFKNRKVTIWSLLGTVNLGQKNQNEATMQLSEISHSHIRAFNLLPLTVRCAKLILAKALTLCWEISLKRPGWTLAFQTWSVIGERSNRWFNTNNTLSPQNKRRCCIFRSMKIGVWKSYCNTRTWGKF